MRGVKRRGGHVEITGWAPSKPYTPQTNGLVERFNGRVQREVLGITIYSHRDLETLLKGFNLAYNRRRQRVLKGRSPEQVVQRRLEAEPKLANRRAKPPDPGALPHALKVVAAAKEVSHPDSAIGLRRFVPHGSDLTLPLPLGTRHCAPRLRSGWRVPGRIRQRIAGISGCFCQSVQRTGRRLREDPREG